MGAGYLWGAVVLDEILPGLHLPPWPSYGMGPGSRGTCGSRRSNGPDGQCGLCMVHDAATMTDAHMSCASPRRSDMARRCHAADANVSASVIQCNTFYLLQSPRDAWRST